MDLRPRLVTVLALSAVLAAPARAQQPGAGMTLDLELATLFDGGLATADGRSGALGGEGGVALRFHSSPRRPGLQLEYASALRRFHDAPAWDRSAHRASVRLSAGLGAVRLETLGRVSRDQPMEERQLLDRLLLLPSVDVEIGRHSRVRGYGGVSMQRGSLARETRAGMLTGGELRHRLGRRGAAIVAYRQERENGVGAVAGPERSSASAKLQAAPTRHVAITAELRHTESLDPRRLVRLDASEAPRHDRSLLHGAELQLRREPLEARLSYGYEVRTSNDARRERTAHHLTLTLRRSVSLAGGPTGPRFDEDPWDLLAPATAGAADGGHTAFHGLSVGGELACALVDGGGALCWAPGAGPAPAAGGARPPDGEWHLLVPGPGANSCALAPDGSAHCWNHTGAPAHLGPGFRFPDAPTAVAPALRFTDLTVGVGHACGLTAEGSLHCWGSNTDGVLGDGGFDAAAEPVPVASGVRFAAVAAGARHTCALALDGALLCWGSNTRGQLGLPASRRVPLPTEVAGRRFAAVTAGEAHTCALDGAGRAWCWGADDSGQLGAVAGGGHGAPTPAAAPLVFTQLSAGARHTCGISDGAVYCWGGNALGQLGTGARDDRPHPTPLRVAGGADFVAVSASSRTCALDGEGVVHCWGGRRGPVDIADDALLPAPLPHGSR